MKYEDFDLKYQQNQLTTKKHPCSTTLAAVHACA